MCYYLNVHFQGQRVNFVLWCSLTTSSVALIVQRGVMELGINTDFEKYIDNVLRCLIWCWTVQALTGETGKQSKLKGFEPRTWMRRLLTDMRNETCGTRINGQVWGWWLLRLGLLFGGLSETHTETGARTETGTHEETSHIETDSYDGCNSEGPTATHSRGTVGGGRTASSFRWQAANYLLTECNTIRDSHVAGINLPC